jgi:hypothetical protein
MVAKYCGFTRAIQDGVGDDFELECRDNSVRAIVQTQCPSEGRSVRETGRRSCAVRWVLDLV